MVFHAGTRIDSGRLLTSGGRVLCVTALGETVRSARRRSYDALTQVRFEGLHYRTDIGHRALGGAG
jgi:phosphoribosylamine--glycine ligase